ncbi:unnamed protein product, partial [marine sediment metagenome]
FLAASIPRIAQEKELVEFGVHNLRDYADDARGTVDDRPFGGGPGMVLLSGPVFKAVEDIRGDDESAELVMLSPQGERFSQETARELARAERLVLLSGRYEGFDERIRLGLEPREISIGDYVLSGGELPAMVVMDCVVRLVPGVLGDEKSVEEESFSEGILEYPHYTRPREFRGMSVPDVLVSGDHGRIARWRAEEALRRTRRRRSD